MGGFSQFNEVFVFISPVLEKENSSISSSCMVLMVISISCLFFRSSKQYATVCFWIQCKDAILQGVNQFGWVRSEKHFQHPWWVGRKAISVDAISENDNAYKSKVYFPKKLLQPVLPLMPLSKAVKWCVEHFLKQPIPYFGYIVFTGQLHIACGIDYLFGFIATCQQQDCATKSDYCFHISDGFLILRYHNSWS